MSNLTTSPCRDFPLQMWLLLSEELAAAEQKFWRAHLQSCARCQEIFANAQSVQEQYAHLPLAEAPARVLQKVIRRAPTQRRFARWEAFAQRLAIFFDRKPRLVLAGFASAVLLLGFHYLAFKEPAQSAWEASAFDAQVDALSHSLMKYYAVTDDEFNRDDYAIAAEFSWDERATDLRASIAALEKELQNSKL
jgi:hypothetical protein